MNRFYPFVLVASVLVALPACSGGSSPAGPSPTAVPTATPTVTPTASPSPTPRPAATDATISVSASTNTHAYTIVILTDASATVSQDGYTGTTTIAAADAATFFSDLNANVPVSGVQTDGGCLKSASYGTTTQITYAGSETGDVSCPPSSTSPAQTLYTDTTTIENDMQKTLGTFTH